MTYSTVVTINAALCLFFVWRSARDRFPVGAVVFAALGCGCGFLAGLL